MQKQHAMIVCTLCFLLSTIACQPPGDSEVERVRMHTLLNIPMVEARIGTRGPFLFLLDTGVSTSVVDVDLARQLKIKSGSPRNSRGATQGSKLTYSLAPEVELSIADLKFEAQNVTIAPFTETARMMMGKAVHGILGKPFFEQYIVELDYQNSEVIFHNPRYYQYQGTGESVPITFVRQMAGLPVVKATFESYTGKPVEIDLLIDSGGGTMGGLSLGTQRSIDAIVDPNARRVPVMGATGLANTPEMTQNRAFTTRLNKISIGSFDFSKPLVGCILDTAPYGIVGAEVLRRFKVIFDFPNTRMILEPTSLVDSPFEEDKSGMFLTAATDDIGVVKVAQVAPGYAGDKAGLEVGDYILSVNGRPVSEITLNGVRALFLESAEYQIEIMREGQKLQATLKTEAML